MTGRPPKAGGLYEFAGHERLPEPVPDRSAPHEPENPVEIVGSYVLMSFVILIVIVEAVRTRIKAGHWLEDQIEE